MNKRYIIKVSLVEIDQNDEQGKEEGILYSVFSFNQDDNPLSFMRIDSMMISAQQLIGDLIVKELDGSFQLEPYINE